MKLLSRRTVFRGRIFDVERDRVRLRHGRPVTLDIVRHGGSVVMIPTPSARQVILVRQYRHAIGRWIWELPAGSLEPGESPAAAARRECVEEIGLLPRRVRRLAALFPTPGFCDEVMTFYRCDRLVRPRTPAEKDEDEQLEPRTFTIREATALLRSGAIRDLKTVLGLGFLGVPVGRAILGPRVAKRRGPDA